LEERWKSWEDEEEDVGGYRIILNKTEDTGTSKSNHQIALSGELDLEEANGPVARQTTE
jgi:hypothetical protein